MKKLSICAAVAAMSLVSSASAIAATFVHVHFTTADGSGELDFSVEGGVATLTGGNVDSNGMSFDVDPAGATVTNSFFTPIEVGPGAPTVSAGTSIVFNTVGGGSNTLFRGLGASTFDGSGILTFVVSLPEPSVWAMFLFGAGAVGALLRGRRAPKRVAVTPVALA